MLTNKLKEINDQIGTLKTEKATKLKSKDKASTETEDVKIKTLESELEE